MLQNVAIAVEHGLEPAAELRLADCLLELIATSYRSASIIDGCARSRGELNRLRAKKIIEEHLRDPELSPQFVAKALGISSRYLRMLFENEGEAVSRYILRRRLEKCAEHLRYGSASRATLTTIAFMNGFSSMAHFSRVFREHFDMPAGRYRALHGQIPHHAATAHASDHTEPRDPAVA
jgi:AraC-like DNA-binding protein